MTIAVNLLLGFVPLLIYGASLAAGTEDDRRHRSVFLLVYGLWALTLAIGNWLQLGLTFWTGLWLVFGVGALVWSFFLRR